MYIYRDFARSAGVYTVGYYVGETFIPESDYNTAEEAAARVHWMNGGIEPGVAELREALENLVRLLDTKDGNLNVELARKDLRKSAPESDLYIKKARAALGKDARS